MVKVTPCRKRECDLLRQKKEEIRKFVFVYGRNKYTLETKPSKVSIDGRKS
jgi:hypothetical protein